MKRVLTLMLLLGLVAGGAPAVIDPFYENRMESGIRAFQQGNWEEAARQLRIACFGHLDEPMALVGGLVRLAIVEVRLDDEDAFRRTVSRLAELEEQFSAYSQAELPDSVRRQFEAQAARLVPAERLRATAGFQAIAERADVQRLAALPPERRRTELTTRLEAEPGRTELLLEMVRLELSDRQPQAALGWLDRLPAEVVALPPASCLRQQAATESGDCGRMDLGQPFCHNIPPQVAEFRLQCLVDAGRWAEAAEVADSLSPELLARRRIARLQRKVRKNLGTAGDAPAAPSMPLAAPPQIEIAAASPAAAEEPDPVGEAAEPQELQQLRNRLAASETSDELAALRGAAEDLADRHSDSRPARLLAAEIAYLQADWPAAVDHFQRAGDLRPDETELAFYQAVALYESGDPAAAAAVLGPIAARLERTSFVNLYLSRILSPGI